MFLFPNRHVYTCSQWIRQMLHFVTEKDLCHWMEENNKLLHPCLFHLMEKHFPFSTTILQPFSPICRMELATRLVWTWGTSAPSEAQVWVRNTQDASCFITRRQWQDVLSQFLFQTFLLKDPEFILCLLSSAFHSVLSWLTTAKKSSFFFQKYKVPYIRPCSYYQTYTHTHTRLSYNFEITSGCRWWLILCPWCNHIWHRGDETFGRMGVHAASVGPHSAPGELQLLCRW